MHLSCFCHLRKSQKRHKFLVKSLMHCQPTHTSSRHILAQVLAHKERDAQQMHQLLKLTFSKLDKQLQRATDAEHRATECARARCVLRRRRTRLERGTQTPGRASPSEHLFPEDQRHRVVTGYVPLLLYFHVYILNFFKVTAQNSLTPCTTAHLTKIHMNFLHLPFHPHHSYITIPVTPLLVDSRT